MRHIEKLPIVVMLCIAGSMATCGIGHSAQEPLVTGQDPADDGAPNPVEVESARKPIE